MIDDKMLVPAARLVAVFPATDDPILSGVQRGDLLVRYNGAVREYCVFGVTEWAPVTIAKPDHPTPT